MAKDTNILKCPNCESVTESKLSSAICVQCGNVAVVLDDGAFEAAAQGDEVVKAKKPDKKPAADTSNRPAESGGRVF